ncbi:transmembrane and coiled-coil domain-containing protein 4 isoform X3 [Vidua macroura]|nr:transmembrane and coiled-coil domain-containing protein 4 isoform X3 [Vidua macroura]
MRNGARQHPLIPRHPLRCSRGQLGLLEHGTDSTKMVGLIPSVGHSLHDHVMITAGPFQFRVCCGPLSALHPLSPAQLPPSPRTWPRRWRSAGGQAGLGRKGRALAAVVGARFPARGARFPVLGTRPGRRQVKMAAEEKWKGWASKQQKEAEHGGEREPGVLLGRQLAEPGRFAYAALCGTSLAWLFPENEQSSFRTEFIKGFVKWLDLPDAVLPAMTAFADGLGGEGTETFTEILRKDPILKENPLLITQDLLSFSLQDGSYDARARVLICRVSWLLRIPLEDLEVLEESLLESLKEQKEEESETAEVSRKKKERRKKLKRYLLIGLATVGGGTVIGLTGGLAAPLVAAGAATIIGSAGAAALGSTAGIAVMASLFGAAGAGLTGYKMKKRVGAIEEFEFLPLTEGKHLHITIAITGWLCTGKYGSFTAPWSSVLHSSEQYCLAWESKYLMELGNTLDSLLNGFVNMMAQEALKFTVLSGIVTALTWPASLLTVASVIDNPWGVCLHRSAEVGKHLAHILLSRQQGQRPVTLIGFSLGARVIYFCLQEMAQEKDSQGIIEDVVLLGAPVEGEAKHWRALTRVVSGRIINGFCR